MNLREQARHAASHIDVPEERDLGSIDENDYADAASGVWEPIVDDLVLAVALYSGRIETWDLTDEQKDAAKRAGEFVDQRLDEVLKP